LQLVLDEIACVDNLVNQALEVFELEDDTVSVDLYDIPEPGQLSPWAVGCTAYPMVFSSTWHFGLDELLHGHLLMPSPKVKFICNLKGFTT
jgi:hypothetical protein